MAIPLLIEVGLVSRISALGSFDYSLFSKLLITLNFGLLGIESEVLKKLSDHLRATLLKFYGTSIFIIYDKTQKILHHVYIIIPSPTGKTSEGNNLLECLAIIIHTLKASGTAKPKAVTSKLGLDYCQILGIPDLNRFNKLLTKCLNDNWS